MRRVIVLGATGSIGGDALDVIRTHRDRFEVVGLAAGSDHELLDAIAQEFDVVETALGTEDSARLVRSVDADVVFNGIAGSAGIAPTLAALESERMLALANKESLTVAGELVMARARPGQILPVDSEQSALIQVLRASVIENVRRLVLTASGGPFRGRTRESLESVSPAEAGSHPVYHYGPRLATNAATFVNKGLEVIEAHTLFGLPYSAIDVVVHPEAYVDSMVEFIDGFTAALMSTPDLHPHIALALGWPDRVPQAGVPIDWSTARTWTFEPVDEDTFGAVRLAKRVGEAGASYPAVFTSANEAAVEAFLDGRLGFLGILEVVESVVDAHEAVSELSLEGIEQAQAWAREAAHRRIEKAS